MAVSADHAIEGLDSVVLFVDDLAASRAFYAETLGLPVVLDDGIVVVLSLNRGLLVLHRNDQGHDERGVWPAGSDAGVRRSCGQYKTPCGVVSYSRLTRMDGRSRSLA